MTLTRTAFLHRDYLHWYTHSMPRIVYQYVEDHLNGEDIAMSMFVTSLTNGQIPLLADNWARGMLLTLKSPESIHLVKFHNQRRNHCTNIFSDHLGLRNGTKEIKNIPLNSSINEHEWNLTDPGIPMTDVHPREAAILNKTLLWGHMTRRDFENVIVTNQKLFGAATEILAQLYPDVNSTNILEI